MSDPSWKSVVKNPDERKVFEALADPKWDFRTLSGLAQSTGLNSDRIKTVLDHYSDLVRRSAVPGPEGADLYTLKKDASTRETLSILRGAFSKSSPSY